MSAEVSISASLAELAAAAQAVHERITAIISSLPDNPRIVRISGSPNCYAICNSELSGRHVGLSNWSVFFHDFKAQHAYICKRIKDMQPESIAAFLRRIVDEGYAVDHSVQYKKVTFHPGVRDQIKKIL